MSSLSFGFEARWSDASDVSSQLAGRLLYEIESLSVTC
jgi:hypothetical protein